MSPILSLQNKNRLLLILFALSLPVFLLLFSSKAVLFFTPLTPAQDATLAFVGDKSALPINFTAEEQSHLIDVQKVMNKLDLVFYTALFLATLCLTAMRKNRPMLKKLFLFGGLSTIILIAVIGLSSIISFDAAFTIFHQLFFPQGNWQFPADSLLIQAFPLEFFISTARTIFLLAFALGSLFILLALFWKHEHQSGRA